MKDRFYVALTASAFFLGTFAHGREVTFECFAPNATTVSVAGTFNDWNTDAHPLASRRDGRWTTEIDLAPGSYGYKFVVDGEWSMDSDNPRTIAVNGVENSLLVVEEPGPTVSPSQDVPDGLHVWTSRSGKTLRASFHSIQRGAVQLENEQGGLVKIAFSSLSGADQALVRELTRKEPEQPSVPTRPPPRASSLVVGGVTIEPGTKNLLRAALNKDQAKRAKGDGNPKISESLVALAVPRNFDPSANYPLVIISQTSDGDASSVSHMDEYLDTALQKGWVIMAADPPEKAWKDSTMWRCALIEAGLDALYEAWPSSRKWPMALAGFSGGAKRSCLLSGILAKEKRPLCGVFLGGCNEDFMTLAMREYRPNRSAYRLVPVYICSGEQDKVCTPRQTEDVYKQIKSSGFKQVRMTTYQGEHWLSRERFGEALDWFREVGKASK